MSEILVKYKNNKAFQAIRDLARYFDIEIKGPVKWENEIENKKISSLPISFAEHPNANALSGIWEGKDVTIDDIREQAWNRSV